MITIMDVYELVWTQGPFVFGVHEATEASGAVDLLTEIRERLKRDDQ